MGCTNFLSHGTLGAMGFYLTFWWLITTGRKNFGEKIPRSTNMWGHVQNSSIDFGPFLAFLDISEMKNDSSS